MGCKIVHMHALSDDEDRAFALVVEARDERVRVPLVQPIAPCVRQRVDSLCGSSMMNMSPPSPVSAPPTEVVLKKLRFVVVTSSSVLFTMRIFGNARRYQSNSTIVLKSAPCLEASSLP